ncbi:hypothetical protein DEH69_03865 [Streptomyces sp. PT12]|nr:hypothetical protein DEH69_03865 [Streptomyces sp. PT12]
MPESPKSARNLAKLESVGKVYGTRAVLDGVSLGVGEGDRIGVVGRDGDGKTTLVRVPARQEEPDDGRVTHSGGLRLGVLAQHDPLDPSATVRQEVIGDLADHEWAGDARVRAVLTGLFGGLDLPGFPAGLDTVIGPLSGGERRRRLQILRLLMDEPNVLFLDEPNTQEPYVVRLPPFSRSEGRSWGACRTRAAHRVARPRPSGRTPRKAGAR